MEWPCRWLWEAKRGYRWMLSWLLWDKFLLGDVAMPSLLVVLRLVAWTSQNHTSRLIVTSKKQMQVFGPEPADQTDVFLWAWALVLLPPQCLRAQPCYDSAALSGLGNQMLLRLFYSCLASLYASVYCGELLTMVDSFIPEGGGGGEAGIHFCHSLFLLIENKHSFIPVSKLLYLKFLI